MALRSTSAHAGRHGFDSVNDPEVSGRARSAGWGCVASFGSSILSLPPAEGVLPLLTAPGGFGNGWIAAVRLIGPPSGGSRVLQPSCGQPGENGGQCVDQISGHEAGGVSRGRQVKPPSVAGAVGRPAVDPGAGGGGPEGGKAQGGQ